MTKSKIILGVNTYHADSSACLIINGKLVAAIEEERLNRIKQYAGLPSKAIKDCLIIGDVVEKDITDIAFNTKPLSNIIPKGMYFLKNLSLRENFAKKRFLKKKNIHKILHEKLDLNKKVKFHYIEHHLAHIASAYYPSEFKKTNALSIDGSGDFVSFSYAKCSENKIVIIKKNYFPNSLGIFYHAMTQFLGYKNYGDEYKIMGLAAYGKPIYYEKILANLFKNNKKLFTLNLDFFNHHKKNFKYIADKNLLIDEIFSSKLKILFSEEINQENSGGCALNSTANKFLTDKNNFFDNIFINCAPGDNGGALGAAFIVAANYGLKLTNIKSPYLGKKFDDDQVKRVLENNHYKKKTLLYLFQVR